MYLLYCFYVEEKMMVYNNDFYQMSLSQSEWTILHGSIIYSFVSGMFATAEITTTICFALIYFSCHFAAYAGHVTGAYLCMPVSDK